jgi:myo-inositol-1(or 4)-monophosphatase
MFEKMQSRKLESWYKAPRDLVTEADIASDQAITKVLKAAPIPANILSEESASTGGDVELTWLVDPLCGTVPFSRGMGHWGVNVALMSGRELVAGGMYVPSLGEELVAVRGGGVERNGKRWKAPQPVHELLENTVVVLEHSVADEFIAFVLEEHRWLSKLGHINVFNSGAYPIALMCLGRLSGGVFPYTGKVHAAAGAVVAQELGLKVSDSMGKEIDWSSNDFIPLLVIAVPSLHLQLLKLINER